jgi:hypothetical protein
MRAARIKLATVERDSVHHCMTRTVDGAFLLDDVVKEILRKQLWQVADCSGVARVFTPSPPAFSGGDWMSFNAGCRPKVPRERLGANASVR